MAGLQDCCSQLIDALTNCRQKHHLAQKQRWCFCFVAWCFAEEFLDHTVEMKISLVRAVFPSWLVKKLYNKYIKRHLVENTVYYKEEK